MKTKNPEDIVLSKIEEEGIELWNTINCNEVAHYNVKKNIIVAPLDISTEDRTYILFHELRRHYQWKRITLSMMIVQTIKEKIFDRKYQLFCLCSGLALNINFLVLMTLPLLIQWFIELDANIYASRHQLNWGMFWKSQWSYTKIPLTIFTIGYIIQIAISYILK